MDEKMIMICFNCDYEWNYTGKKKPNKNYVQYIACPRCRSNVQIKKSKGE